MSALYGAAGVIRDPVLAELLLDAGGDPNEPTGGVVGPSWGSLLLRAIGIRCSPRHVAVLLAAGADPRARTPEGVGAYRLAMQAGLTEVAAMLGAAGAAEELTEDLPRPEYVRTA